MKNLLNIDDQVKVIMPGVMGDGETVKVIQIDMISGDLYYTGAYHVNCPDGGEGYDTSIQFKDGQYEIVGTSNSAQSSIRNISVKISLDGIDDVKNNLNSLEVQMDKIIEKIKQIKLYN